MFVLQARIDLRSSQPNTVDSFKIETREVILDHSLCK